MKQLSKRKMIEKTSASNTTLWRWVKEGKLPEPTKINGRSFWVEEQVDEALKKLHDVSQK